MTISIKLNFARKENDAAGDFQIQLKSNGGFSYENVANSGSTSADLKIFPVLRAVFIRWKPLGQV